MDAIQTDCPKIKSYILEVEHFWYPPKDVILDELLPRVVLEINLISMDVGAHWEGPYVATKSTWYWLKLHKALDKVYSSQSEIPISYRARSPSPCRARSPPRPARYASPRRGWSPYDDRRYFNVCSRLIHLTNRSSCKILQPVKVTS